MQPFARGARQQHYLANHDSLTGLLNRAAFQGRLEQSLLQATWQRLAGLPGIMAGAAANGVDDLEMLSRDAAREWNASSAAC